MAAPELSPVERAAVDRFDIHGAGTGLALTATIQVDDAGPFVQGTFGTRYSLGSPESTPAEQLEFLDQHLRVARKNGMVPAEVDVLLDAWLELASGGN